MYYSTRSAARLNNSRRRYATTIPQRHFDRLDRSGEREAIASGLVHTGRLITSAAAIMLVVFGAFMLGDFLLMKMLGLALAVAVLLDASVMRLAVSPALLVLAGRWNWWPGERTRAQVSEAFSTSASRARSL